MCGKNQISVLVRPYPEQEEPKPREGWDEIDHTIANGEAEMKWVIGKSPNIPLNIGTSVVR